MKQLTLGFIGLGLIGGSLAKTFRRKIPDCKIIACDTDQQTLRLAKEDHTIDEYCASIDQHFLTCNFMFLCASVSANQAYLHTLKEMRNDMRNCTITDVSSIKSKIHETALLEGLSDCFIGGHPMAGLETTGYSQANSYLFENVYYILTPSKDVSKERLDTLRTLLSKIDVIPITLSAKEHDYATACVSHLPHLISAALVNLVKNADGKDEILKSIAAGGFKDITRISSSSAQMWNQICLGNKEEILPLLDQYIQSLQSIFEIIDNEDSKELLNYFQSAKDYRDSISDTTGGAIFKSYCLYCDLKDEAGQLATVASLLAAKSINIKNIGIIHNREFEQGVLRIECYNAASLQLAIRLLEEANYHIYERH